MFLIRIKQPVEWAIGDRLLIPMGQGRLRADWVEPGDLDGDGLVLREDLIYYTTLARMLYLTENDL